VAVPSYTSDLTTIATGDLNVDAGTWGEPGDSFVTEANSIKEVYELVDVREELEVNSYTQGNLEYLVSKIKRD